ncbi:MAG: Centromere-binding protein ParB C-terminal [Mycobacteriales bacterium]
MASKSAAEPAGHADARVRGRPGSAGLDHPVTLPDELPGGAVDGAPGVAPAGRGDWPEDPARLELRTTVTESDLPPAADVAPVNGLRAALADGSLAGPAGGPLAGPADGSLDGSADGSLAGSVDGSLAGSAGIATGVAGGPGVPGLDAGFDDGDEELITATGIPPEVASFLAESAAAAGVGLDEALRAAGVRSSRRSRTSPDRVQRSFYLSRDLVDRARAAVSATMRHPGEAYNVSQLAGRALENEVLRLERDYNNGKRFPPVSHVPSGPSPEGVERIRTGVTTPRRRRPT